MILKSENKRFTDFNASTFITIRQLTRILDKANVFKTELLRVFGVTEDQADVLQIGNARFLLDSLQNLDDQCEKIDLVTQVKHIHLKQLLEGEKALFELFAVTNSFVLTKNHSDLLVAETRYAAKNDLLDYYNFSKFANYCRDQEFDNLVAVIKDYLEAKNSGNKEERSLRLLYHHEAEQFYIRAITSNDYRDYGINFSVYVALLALGRYVVSSQNEIFIDDYKVNDSELYVSFSLKNQVKISENLSLSFNLILENDEIKRNAISFNGVFKLRFADNKKSSELLIRPRGVKTEDKAHPVDLLTFAHRGKVDSIFERIQNLPKLIDFFISQVSDDAKRISAIQNPDDVKKLIRDKVQNSRKAEFRIYKEAIVRKLTSINVDTTFQLFELLREVEELFEHDDVISRNFWRTKLYESLIERE